MKKFISYILSVLIGLMVWQDVHAQDKMIDQIVAVVGSKIILQSDIESQYLQMRAEGINMPGMKCVILEQLMEQKLLLNQAEVDSITVNESSVEMELNSRLDYFISQIGSEAKLEEYFNKSIREIKQEFRNNIRNLMITQQMQNEIIGSLTVTPSEVKAFYKTLPEDSIPFIDTQVEYRQILRYPPYSEESIFEVKERLLELRRRILDGENFATLAVLYSEGPSAPRGGEIGYLSRSELDPAYAKAAFSLKKGGISSIVESEFGYHIIQLIDRNEDRVNTRHILLKPKSSPEAQQETLNRLDSIARLIRMDSISFENAAKLISQDENSAVNGGLVVNRQTATTRFEPDQIDPSDSRIIRNLKVGEISEPFRSVDDKGKDVYKIIKLINRIEPHKANLKQDYREIQQMARVRKQDRIVSKWIGEKINETYISLDAAHKQCDFSREGWKK